MAITAQDTEIKPGYRLTEVGVIPEGWNTEILEAVCVPGGLVRGPFGGSLKKEFFTKDGFKVYEQRNAIYRDADTGFYFINENKYKELKRFEVKEGDFIISCSGTIGKIFQIPRDAKAGIINQALLKIKTDSRVIHDRFFFYIFDWDKFQQKIIDNTQGGAMQNLVGMDIFRNILIPLPPLSEQTAIATALSDVDVLIASLDKLIAKKRDIKQATVQQLLTGKTRLPGFGKGVKQTYKQTEAGVIPEDWEVKELGDLTTLLTNGFVGKATDFYTNSDDGILYIQGFNVEDNSYNFTGIKRVTLEFHKKHSKSHLLEGDLLTIQTGEIGLTTIVTKELEGSNCHALIISRFKKEFDSKYFSYYFNSFRGRARFKDIETGSIMKHLNVGDLHTLLVPFPSAKSEQTAIATVLSNMDAEIAALEQRCDKTRALKRGMMQELLTGKTRLL